MKRDVLVAVSGVQLSLDGESPVEVLSKGRYYKKNGKTYIKYIEVDEDNNTTECMIKIDGDCVEILKKGDMNFCLVFEKDKNCITNYDTPFGNLVMGVTTTDMIVLEDDDAIVIKIRYMLDINYSFVSECTVDIKVVSTQ